MRKMSRGKKLMFLATVVPLGILVVIGIGGGLVMLLWNWLMPTLFGLASGHVLAGPWTPRSVPTSLRGFGTSLLRGLPHAPSHGGALGGHDPGGEGTHPEGDARPLGLRPLRGRDRESLTPSVLRRRRRWSVEAPALEERLDRGLRTREVLEQHHRVLAAPA